MDNWREVIKVFNLGKKMFLDVILHNRGVFVNDDGNEEVL